MNMRGATAPLICLQIAIIEQTRNVTIRAKPQDSFVQAFEKKFSGKNLQPPWTNSRPVRTSWPSTNGKLHRYM